MEPITLTLRIIDNALAIWRMTLEAMSPEDRAKVAHDYVENMERWQKFLDDAKGGFATWKLPTLQLTKIEQ